MTQQSRYLSLSLAIDFAKTNTPTTTLIGSPSALLEAAELFHSYVIKDDPTLEQARQSILESMQKMALNTPQTAPTRPITKFDDYDPDDYKN